MKFTSCGKIMSEEVKKVNKQQNLLGKQMCAICILYLGVQVGTKGNSRRQRDYGEAV